MRQYTSFNMALEDKDLERVFVIGLLGSSLPPVLITTDPALALQKLEESQIQYVLSVVYRKKTT